MNKNIFLSTLLAFNVCLQLRAMEHVAIDNANQFTIKTDNLYLQFRRINLSEILGDTDCQILRDHCGDYEAVQSMFGTFVAIGYKCMELCSPANRLSFWLGAYQDKLAQKPENQKLEYLWFIELLQEMKEAPECVGLFSVSSYAGDRPDSYADKLLFEIALVLDEEYRHKGITSQCMQPVLQKLMTFKPFQHGIFCFDTPTVNEAVHNIAAKFGAQLIYSRDKDVACGKFKTPFDLFIIPRQ